MVNFIFLTAEGVIKLLSHRNDSASRIVSAFVITVLPERGGTGRSDR